METILKVDVGEYGIVGYAVYVESNIRKWSMVNDVIFVDNPEITTNLSEVGKDNDTFIVHELRNRDRYGTRVRQEKCPFAQSQIWP